jgi:hypothetical protein
MYICKWQKQISVLTGTTGAAILECAPVMEYEQCVTNDLLIGQMFTKSNPNI